MDSLSELRVCLTRAVTIIGTFVDKVELTDEQKDDFVRITNVVKKYETQQADETKPQ